VTKRESVTDRSFEKFRYVGKIQQFECCSALLNCKEQDTSAHACTHAHGHTPHHTTERHITFILPFPSGSETWLFILRKEHRRQAFENKVK
jgi:hypothetical protein